MAEKRTPADNPASALFDLADEMSANYEKIRYIKYYAYLFVGLTLLLLLVLFISTLAQGNTAGAAISLALIICGLILLRLVVFTKNFLDDFHTNFKVISRVREIDPLPKVPEGKNLVERFERYLRKGDPVIKEQLGKGAEVIRGMNYGGMSWPLAAVRRPKFLGPGKYLALVWKGGGKPSMADLVRVQKAAAHPGSDFPPDQIILLYRAPGTYDGLSDDLYTYLTEKVHTIPAGGKESQLKLQVVVECDRRYEIIPLLP